MKNNLDKHIDAKLKTSFDAFQKKAPEHLWKQITEEMNGKDLIDESLDEKVQEGHLNAPLKKAPASIWNKIEDTLDKTTPIDTVLDEKVKNGFLSDPKNIAPAFLWEAISGELSTPPIPVDKVLDDKLKEGFLSQETKKTPNKVWYGVSRQLNIDKTWDRISKVLDVEPIVSDWSGRMFRFLAGAAMLLLLLKTCNHEPYTLPNSDLVQEVNLTKEKGRIAANNSSPSSKKQERVAQKKNGSKTVESPNFAQSTPSKIIKEKLVESLPTQTPTHSSNKEKTEIIKGKTLNVIPSVKENKETSSSKVPPIIAAVDSKAPEDRSTSIAENDGNEGKGGSVATQDQSEDKAIQETKVDLNGINLTLLGPNPLVLPNIVEPIQLLEEIKLEKKSKKNLVEGKLEAGAFVVVNSTMLLNNETREGFDQNSLTTNYFGLAANYGLWASYRITPKGALVAEFSINADNRQSYGLYEKGVFYIKEWVMKYNRFSLAYKHDLWQTSTDKLVNTKVVAQAGVYVGLMREAKLFYDGVLFFDKQSDYHQFDFGFKVALGQEILIDKFVLGYGIRSDIGASNIFKGNNNINAREDQTNIINLGGYVLFGYRF